MSQIGIGSHIIVQTPRGPRAAHLSAFAGQSTSLAGPCVNARILLDGADDIPMTCDSEAGPLFCQSDGWIGNIPFDGSATPAIGTWAPAP
jgi:hypothetical protein